MLSDPRIRPAHLDDAVAVWPLARDFATSFIPQRDAFEATFAALVDARDTLLVVAETSPAGVVGYLLANAHPTFLANGPVVWVEEIMVADAARRLGIGRLLMTAAEEWATEAGAAYVSLATRRARDFYLALEYEDSATFFKKTLVRD
jgi:GNAT superfamily N-acetyltransferase